MLRSCLEFWRCMMQPPTNGWLSPNSVQEAGTNPFSFDTSRNEVDPRLSLSIPKDVNQVVVSLEDLLGRGGTGFGYRLTAFPQPPDFSVELVTPYVNLPENGTAAIEVLVGRRGYDGPIRLSIPDLPGGFDSARRKHPRRAKSSRRPPGFFVGISDANRKTRRKASTFRSQRMGRSDRIQFSHPQAGSGSGHGSAHSWASTEILQGPLAGHRASDVRGKLCSSDRSKLAKQHVRIVQGGDYALPWKLVKGPQAGGNIKVENPRPTASIKDLRVLRRPEGMDYMEEGTFHILTTYATPPATFDLVMDASLTTGMKSERLITAPAVTVEIVPGYGVKLMSETRDPPGRDPRSERHN